MPSDDLSPDAATPPHDAPMPDVGATAAERPEHVAVALDALSELDGSALSDHPRIYERIHADLSTALAEIDYA